MKLLALLSITALLLAACSPIVDPAADQPQNPVPGESIPADTDAPAAMPESGKPFPYEFVGIDKWFNLDGVVDGTELKREDLIGKVVLVDFWTYSCINCIRTLPYVTSWDEKYRKDGLVIVGIHAPEFDFEKDPSNVQAALLKYNIHYPVGLDNNHVTWDNYRNHYWPHSYLFDRNGNLVFDHIGEGGYDELEAKIQEQLDVHENMTVVESPQFLKISTPEIYLGGQTSRGNNAYDLTLGSHTYTLPDAPERNEVQLGGEWTIAPEYIESGADATLRLFYHAKDIHVVAGGTGTVSGTIQIKDSSSIIPKSTIDGDQLYTLSSTDYKDQTITLKVSPGVRFYSFTFG